MDILQENPVFLDFVERNYKFHIRRLSLLERIFREMESCKKERVKKDIYLYGSMIREQDLLARQMFLWLLELIEEKEPDTIKWDGSVK